MRRSFIILLLFVLAASAGCSKKQVKPVPEGAVYYNNANKIIQVLRNGYAAKDPGIIKAVSTQNGLNAIVPNLGRFDSVELTFTTKWMDVSNGGATVNVEWKGVWTKDGKKDSESGMAVFVLTGNPLKFDKILTGNPFIY
ncbi:MAG: hypothetical protein M0Z61_03780 [Nitrospiraceae bacterium]|nr:hypothetical protein [Nitrospiraceae bacterium]